MPNFTAGTSFTDGVTNDVTAAKLNALVADAVPTSSLALNSTTGTIGLFSSGTGTAATPAIQPTGDTNTGIFFPAADTIAFSEGGAEAMRIDSSGNVGVGVTPSAWGTAYRKAVEVGSGCIAGVSGGGASDYFSITGNAFVNSSASYIYKASASAVRYEASAGEHRWYNAPSGTAGNAISFTQAMTLDSSGNVGVGTTSPATRVDIRSSSGTGSLVTLANNSAASSANVVETRYMVGNTYSGLDVIASIGAINPFTSTNNYGDIFFKTATPSGLTERLRIDSSGKVLVGGTTAFGVGAGGITSTVASGSNLALEKSTGASIAFYQSGVNTSLIQDASSGLQLLTGTSGSLTERLRIDSSGGVTIAGLAGSGSRAVNASAAGLLSAASDASLKEEVVGAHIAGLNEILQIHPKMYRWKDDIANRGENASAELGFIANDVAPIIPSAAPLGNDGLYGFYDRSITAALVKSVQELSAKVTALEAA